MEALPILLHMETRASVGVVLPEVCPPPPLDRYKILISAAEPAADGVKRRRKRNRWGEAGENKAAGLMGLPTMIQANMTAEQLDAYTLHLRIEEME